MSEAFWSNEGDRLEHDEERLYEHPRDEVLDIMCQNGWAEQLGGSLAAPTGAFACITNDQDRLPHIETSFGLLMTSMGIEPEQLLGNYMVFRKPVDKFITVVELDSPDMMRALFDEYDLIFTRWRNRQS